MNRLVVHDICLVPDEVPYEVPDNKQIITKNYSCTLSRAIVPWLAIQTIALNS